MLKLKAVTVVLFLLWASGTSAQNQSFKAFPYKTAGLDEKRAAVHLLSRFTFGFSQRDLDGVLRIGLEEWFMKQLNASYKDEKLQQQLTEYADLNLNNQQLSKIYPRNTLVRKWMLDEGYIEQDSLDQQSVYYRQKLKAYLAEKGYRPEQELYKQFIAAKFMRAASSENQLQEVMTDFWFNHFNVSFTKSQAAPFIPSYENHTIRPRSLGDFESLLLAVAKSPAMLLFLDNASSVADNPQSKRKSGLNENYARELLELHTLGVDGGYTQTDVTQAARILTGWTNFPMQGYGNQNLLTRLSKAGNYHEEDFIFVANKHDKSTKNVLGHDFKEDGYEEGVALLRMLVKQKQTAYFICRKIAVKFVQDEPSERLVAHMSKVFIESRGDIKKVLMSMVCEPEFWSKDAVHSKVKTPFELAISAVRTLGGEIVNPTKLNNWVTRMGEKKYYYIAPTGFPDKSAYWINTGALLHRMNFGLAFSASQNSGVDVDLLALNNHQEPESAADALQVYSSIIMPTGDVDRVVNRLTPLLTSPDLKNRIERASSDKEEMSDYTAGVGTSNNKRRKLAQNNAMLGQVVGLIIGAPEFQRR